MKKLAVVISSYSGMLKDDIESNGFFILPLQLFVDSKQYFEGFYTNDEKYKIVDSYVRADEFSTSLPPIGMIEEQMEDLSKKYDDVIYIPIDSHLSSTCDILKNNALKYKNVHVFNNRLVGSTMFRVAKHIKNMYEVENKSIPEILKFLDWYNSETFGYIIPRDLKAFVKSGRLKGIKKALLKSIHLVPIIEVGEVLKNVGVARSKKSALTKSIEKILEFVDKQNKSISNYEFFLVWAFDKTMADFIESELKSKYNFDIKYNEEASLATMFHTGVGAIYIGIVPKIK